MQSEESSKEPDPIFIREPQSKKMKTTLPLFRNVAATILFISTLSFCSAKAQNNQELVFSNSTRISGSNGAIGAVYKFPSINGTHDALVKIAGKSHSDVKLNNIDQSSSGYGNAFQPQVEYDGNINSISWWMEFEITFVTINTQSLQVIPGFKATAIDIDGDNSTLNEWVTFYSFNAYTVESITAVTVTNVTDNLAGNLLTSGKRFDGSSNLYTAGVDTSETTVMTTVTYNTSNTVKLRVGGTKTANSNMTNRMYSIWFKNFNYVAPVTLPIKLSAFNAVLNNTSKRVDLSWTSDFENNVSHFIIERSTDGVNYSDAGMVFAFGNTTTKSNYAFPDNISSIQSSVVYYRLRSVDVDGKTQFSEVRIIRISKQADNTITIVTYPNPVSNEVRITVPANWQNKKVLYEVFSVNGQTAKRLETANSNQTETLNMSNLNSGLYIVKVTCEGKTSQQKIIKQ